MPEEVNTQQTQQEQNQTQSDQQQGEGTQTSQTQTQTAPPNQVELQKVIDQVFQKGQELALRRLEEQLGMKIDDLKQKLSMLDQIETQTQTQTQGDQTQQGEKDDEIERRLQEEREKYEQRLKQLEEQQRQFKQLAAQEKVNSILSTALSKYNFASPRAHELARIDLTKYLKVNDDLSVSVVDENGQPRLNMQGQEMSVEELIEQYFADPNNKFLLAPATGPGSGSASTRTVETGINFANLKPEDIRNLSDEEFETLKRELGFTASRNPFREAKRRLQEAGRRLIQGTT